MIREIDRKKSEGEPEISLRVEDKVRPDICRPMSTSFSDIGTWTPGRRPKPSSRYPRPISLPGIGSPGHSHTVTSGTHEITKILANTGLDSTERKSHYLTVANPP